LEQAKAKIYSEIQKAEDDYVRAAREVLEDPVLGKSENVKKMVLQIPYGMGGNAWWSQVVGHRIEPIFFWC
jgi:hypothetical protein